MMNATFQTTKKMETSNLLIVAAIASAIYIYSESSISINITPMYVCMYYLAISPRSRPGFISLLVFSES